MISVNSKKRELIGNFENAGVKTGSLAGSVERSRRMLAGFVDLAMPVKMDPMSLVPPPPKRPLILVAKSAGTGLGCKDIWEEEWGRITIKMGGRPPFGPQYALLHRRLLRAKFCWKSCRVQRWSERPRVGGINYNQRPCGP